MYITANEATYERIEECRESWTEIAKKFDWYFEPFYIQVWIDETGKVLDSVSHKGMQDTQGDLLIVDVLDGGVE